MRDGGRRRHFVTHGRVAESIFHGLGVGEYDARFGEFIDTSGIPRVNTALSRSVAEGFPFLARCLKNLGIF